MQSKSSLSTDPAFDLLRLPPYPAYQFDSTRSEGSAVEVCQCMLEVSFGDVVDEGTVRLEDEKNGFYAYFNRVRLFIGGFGE